MAPTMRSPDDALAAEPCGVSPRAGATRTPLARWIGSSDVGRAGAGVRERIAGSVPRRDVVARR